MASCSPQYTYRTPTDNYMPTPSIFKAYDIRGIYPGEVNASDAYAIGNVFADLIRDRSGKPTPRISVGSDARLSSPELKEALIRGLLEGGADVDDIGLVSTPTFYAVQASDGADGGVQVSASHNPQEWNGFKLVYERSIPVSKTSGMFKVRDAVMHHAVNIAATKGTLRDKSALPGELLRNEIASLSSLHGPLPAFKVAIDTANGMGALDMKALFAGSPASLVWVNEEVDGTFPGHPADPMKPENTVDLRKKIVDAECDVGIASDGDGDRYFVFDEKGDVVPAEIFRGMMAQIELQAHPGGKIVYDVRPGRITKDMIEDAGGEAVLAPVGHSLIKEVMLSCGAIFGAESSGHYFYKLPYGVFEAPVTLIYKFLTHIGGQGKPLSEIVAPFRKYFNSGEINTKLENAEVGNALLAELRRMHAAAVSTDIDGLSVEYADYWFSVRLANTEPLIRLIVEARMREIMEEKRDELLSFIRNRH